jgi:hypothetical protein
MDDRMLLYNNSRDYQENNTAIDPAAVAWTHIQVLNLFIFSVLYINICLVSCSIHNRQLAYSLFIHQFRWKLYCCCW